MIQIRFLLLLFFCFWFSKANLLAQKSEEIKLLEQLKESKIATTRIKSFNDLNIFYRNNDLIEQKKILSKLKKEKTKYISKADLEIIELNVLEEFLSQSNLSDFKKSFRNYQEKQSLNDPVLDSRHQIVRVHYAYFFQNGDYLQIAKNNVSNAIKLRRNQIISDAYINLSNAFAYKNVSDSAFFYGQLATEYASRSNSKTKLALSLRNQSLLYLFFGRNNNAVVKGLEFLQAANELQNQLLISLADKDLGFILLESDNLKGANNYFQRAEQIGENKFDNYEMSLLNCGQFLCEINQGNLKSANEIYSKIKWQSNYLKSEKLQGLFLLAQGKMVEAQMNWNEAIRIYNQAILQFNVRKDFQKISKCYQQIAKCYIKLKKFRNSEQAVLQSIKYNSRLTNQDSNENFKLLAEIYESTNRLSEAFKAQKTYLENEQKLIVSKDAVTINELTESNLREEREQLIEVQKKSIEKERAEKEKLEIQRTRNLLISVFVALVLILGFIILFLRTKQIRSQQDQREAEMSQALLRTQMNPHFVFNAMSVIQSYIFTHNPEKSSKFLVNFSKLMRLILENSPKEFIPLELEHEILEKYLNTQKLRFEGRFEFELEFDEDLIFQKAMVPPMITQPFVENAIEHGQLHSVEQGKISISVKHKNKMLEIIVCDNGIGRNSSAKTKKIKSHKSMAINMTRERIEILNRKYRSTGNLNIEDFDPHTGRGTKVTILLPLKFE